MFLDVGANNGISALGFRRLVPNYSILSIEANRLHEPSLMKRKRDLANFEYMITAAGNENSQFTLYTAMYRGMVLHTGSSLNLDYLKQGLARAYSKGVMKNVTFAEQVVKVIRLDDLHLKPDVIKTDAEGFDWEVLLGLRETIAANRPAVLVEYMSSLPDKLEPFCDELSYALLIYDYRSDRFTPFDRERELKAHAKGGSPVNLFMIPREKVDSLPMERG
jgi:FkbM family methyltransferase